MIDGVRIQLLGGFTVEVDGRTVGTAAWHSGRAADLVKLLALSSRRRLHRERVMETFWPEAAPGTAATGPPGVYEQLSDVRTEVEDARVWSGLHFRNAMQEGDKFGRKVVHHIAPHFFRR